MGLFFKKRSWNSERGKTWDGSRVTRWAGLHLRTLRSCWVAVGFGRSEGRGYVSYTRSVAWSNAAVSSQKSKLWCDVPAPVLGDAGGSSLLCGFARADTPWDATTSRMSPRELRALALHGYFG